MKTEELLEIGLTEEQANKVFAMNGKDVENAKGKLHVGELISREITPEEAPAVYLELNRDRNACLGVIINWKE